MQNTIHIHGRGGNFKPFLNFKEKRESKASISLVQNCLVNAFVGYFMMCYSILKLPMQRNRVWALY